MYTDYCSIKGKGHEYHKMPCQDAGVIFETENLLVVAISDGCSAFPDSDVTARLTLEGLKEFVRQHERVITEDRFNTERFMRLLLVKLKNLYNDNREKYPLSYMSATLAFLIFNNIEGCCHLFSVGDSTILKVKASGHTSVMMLPYRKGRSSTVFSNAFKEAMASYQHQRIEFCENSHETILLLTDGGASAPHHSFSKFVQNLADSDISERKTVLQEFCANIREHTDDDVTVAVLMPEEISRSDRPINERKHTEKGAGNPFKALLNALMTPVTVSELIEMNIYPEGMLLPALIPLVSSGMAVKVAKGDDTAFCLSEEMKKTLSGTENKEE